MTKDDVERHLDLAFAGEAMPRVECELCEPSIEAPYVIARRRCQGRAAQRGRYTITFPTTASMPPVLSEYHGFWSITVYDAATHDFIPSTTHYTINSHDPQYQTQRPEGGIQILIQTDPPPPSPGVYWLQTAKPGGAAKRVLSGAPGLRAAAAGVGDPDLVATGDLAGRVSLRSAGPAITSA